MNNIPEVIRIKQTRRQILTNLNLLYPSPIQLDSLYRTIVHLDPTYDFSLFEKDIVYLNEKGYVLFVDDAIGGSKKFESKVARLTPEGKEIAERTMRDPALEI